MVFVAGNATYTVSVGRSVGHTFTFSLTTNGLYYTCPIHYSPCPLCPTTRDRGCRVYGLVCKPFRFSILGFSILGFQFYLNQNMSYNILNFYCREMLSVKCWMHRLRNTGNFNSIPITDFQLPAQQRRNAYYIFALFSLLFCDVFFCILVENRKESERVWNLLM